MNLTTPKPILCIDFDGVLHSYISGWRGVDVIPDPPVKGAIAFLYRAIFRFHVCIFSSRSAHPEGIEAMKAWVSKHEKEWRGNQKVVPRTSLLLNISFPTEKPPATVSIDDRALTFNGDFNDPQYAMEALLKFKPWNR